jgi:hypothetical protein
MEEYAIAVVFLITENEKSNVHLIHKIVAASHEEYAIRDIVNKELNIYSTSKTSIKLVNHSAIKL